VHLCVSPASARATLWRGWRRRVKLGDERVEGDALAPGHDAGERAADALDRLARRHALGGLPVQVVLADSLVHCDVARGDFAGCNERRLAAFASACSAEMLGDAADQAAVRWQLQRDERHLLVCAAPRTLQERIVDAAARNRLRLTQIAPSFSVQWNRSLPRELPHDCVVAFASGANALVACVRRGVVTTISNGPWHAAHGQAAEDARPGAFDLHVDRLLAGVGLDGEPGLGRVLVHLDRDAPGVSARWKVVAGWQSRRVTR
jgi:hypothetical protein